MPYFKLNGQLIVPTNLNNAIELVDQSKVCNSSGDANDLGDANQVFFATSNDGSGGRVICTGVTDNNCKFVTADSNTSIIDDAEKDGFGGRLKINNNVKYYCKKGCAPLGEQLAEYGPGTYYFYRREDGYCELQDSEGGCVLTLSTAEQNRKYYTFMLCAGGGGGGSGSSGIGYGGGVGGGGAGAVVATIKFKAQTTATFKIVVGSGGNGGSPSNKAGTVGGDSYMVYPSTADSYDSETAILSIGATGGGRGSGGKSSSGGGAGVGLSNGTAYEDVFEMLQCVIATGGKGKKEANGGGSASINLYNYSVNSCYINSIGGTSGASRSGQVGGGGASPFANGNSGENGAGGNGGAGAFTKGKSGKDGGDGFIRIIY